MVFTEGAKIGKGNNKGRGEKKPEQARPKGGSLIWRKKRRNEGGRRVKKVRGGGPAELAVKRSRKGKDAKRQGEGLEAPKSSEVR